jgi:serine/threonine protein kinase
MAPEIARGLPYNCQADVYSYALVVWEMLTGDKPFAHLANASDDMKHCLQHTDDRPTLDDIDDDYWVTLLQGAWHADVLQRSTMAEIYDNLSQCVPAQETLTMEMME